MEKGQTGVKSDIVNGHNDPKASYELRHQKNKMLTEKVAITDQLSKFILMEDSRRGNTLTQRQNLQRTWREQAREKETTECRSIG